NRAPGRARTPTIRRQSHALQPDPHGLGCRSACSSARIERRTSFRCWAAITVPRTTGARLSACRSVFMWMASTVPPTAGAGSVLGQLRFVPGCAALIAWRSSVKWTALMGVPAGNRSPDVASVKTMENVPVTERLSLIVSVHVVAVPLQAPPQPLNRAWVPGVAVSVTVAPTLKLAEQLDPQVIPAGLLVTSPPAEPREITVNVTEIGANVAVTVVAALTVTVQAPVPLHPPPLHPANTDPATAVAVSETVVPRS